MKRAVCLLSGGLDSATALYASVKKGYDALTLTVHYGQRHEKEIRAAQSIARQLGLENHIIHLSLPWKGSALLDETISVPLGRSEAEMSGEIPSTYVPARNSIFLSLAASYAEAAQAEIIVIGANALDYSGYPDCRPEYFQAFSQMLRLGTKAGADGEPIAIEAPLLTFTKKEIVELGMSLGVPFEKTWSCYLGGESPCRECDSCILRAKGFREAGMKDPLSAPIERLTARN